MVLAPDKEETPPLNAKDKVQDLSEDWSSDQPNCKRAKLVEDQEAWVTGLNTFLKTPVVQGSDSEGSDSEGSDSEGYDEGYQQTGLNDWVTGLNTFLKTPL